MRHHATDPEPEMSGDMADTMGTALTLDANAVAGRMRELFGSEMTAAPSACAHCGNVAEMGTLIAFTRGPGIILRCSICSGVVLRIVETPDATFLDARGAAYIRLPRTGT
ncbi:MAG TPA: DUF6510 family protein [Candidatus Saccharimonadales bacterium]|nr:DUF6510 family protein [Candidatus Saccharimonadales bacterium]